MSEMTTAAVIHTLETAVQILEGDGWTQGDYEMGGCFCAAGALNRALNGNAGDEDNQTLKTRGFLEWLIPDDQRDYTTCWNDAPGRTVDEVVDVFEDAIRALKGDPELVDA